MYRMLIVFALVAAAAYGFYSNVSFAAGGDPIQSRCITDSSVDKDRHAQQLADFRKDCESTTAGSYRHVVVRPKKTETSTCAENATLFTCAGVPGQ